MTDAQLYELQSKFQSMPIFYMLPGARPEQVVRVSFASDTIKTVSNAIGCLVVDEYVEVHVLDSKSLEFSDFYVLRPL